MKKIYTEEDCRAIVKQANMNVIKEEWKKHIKFLKEHLGKVIIKDDIDNAVNWYKRIFGKL